MIQIPSHAPTAAPSTPSPHASTDGRWRRRTAACLAALLLAGCATTDLPPISQHGQHFEALPDERALWDEAIEEEAVMLEHVVLYDDPLLEDYLHELVDLLEPPGMAANPDLRYTVRVIDDPALNAFAYPHGSLYLHTGLLARLEDEAQLATVLAHEMTHVEHRHMLRYRRGMHNRQMAIGAIALAASVLASIDAWDEAAEGDYAAAAAIELFSSVLINVGAELAFLASVNGYGRELEWEADYGAFDKMAAAGFDVDQGAVVYEILQEGHDGPSDLEVFFFGSHPRLEERRHAAISWSTARSSGTELAAAPTATDPALEPPPETPPETATTAIAQTEAERRERFVARLQPVVAGEASANFEIGRLALAEQQTTRALAAAPRNPSLHLLAAELHLAQADERPEEEPQRRDQARQALDRARALELDTATSERLDALDARLGATGDTQAAQLGGR
ncbi:MAG: M48 family metalloprotease [Acidobacteriota bacterium]